MRLNTFTKNLIFISLIHTCISCNNTGEQRADTAPADSSAQAEAVKEISRNIESDPENAELYYKRSQIWFAQKYLDRAEADLNKANEIDSLNPLYHFSRARVEYAMNKTLSASVDYERAIQLKPDYLEARLKLADLYYVVKEHAKSINLLNNALRQDKGNAYIYNMLGMNYRDLKDTARAIFHFQTAVETDPSDYQSTLYLANLYAAQNKGIAFEYYNAALKLQPKNAEAWFDRAVFSQNRRLYKQALMDYRRVIDIDPSHYLSYYNVGYINYDNKMYQEALRNWDICTRMNPDYANAYYMKGLVFELTNKRNEALQNYERALELEPGNDMYQAGLNRIR